MKKTFEGYLLVSDMDGTLLNSKGEISERNKKAIEYFVENGGVFTIATGRMRDSVRGFLCDLQVGLPIIIYNGAKIYDFKSEKALHEDSIIDERKEIVKKILDKYPTLGIEVFSDEVDYIVRRCKYTDRLGTSVCDTVSELPQDFYEKKWTKILILGERHELDELEDNFNRICDKATAIRSGEVFLEIVPDFTSKGEALKKLIKEYKIDPSKVIAVGDNMNDKEMLQVAQFGFGISNGEKRLVESAKYKAPSNDEDAIDYIVKWIEDRTK